MRRDMKPESLNDHKAWNNTSKTEHLSLLSQRGAIKTSSFLVKLFAMLLICALYSHTFLAVDYLRRHNNNSTTNVFQEASVEHHLIPPNANHDARFAITVISMGAIATNTNLVDRCLYSIRRCGKFQGYFVIITDHPERHMVLTEQDDKVVILQAKEEDVKAMEGTLPITMRFKRLKTLLINYFDTDSRLDSVRTIAYMDYDVVVGKTLDMFWSDMDRLINEQTMAVTEGASSNTSDISYLYFFEEPWSSLLEPFHTGVMVLDRRTSRHCLSVWREQIDCSKVLRDQTALKLLNEKLLNELTQNGTEHSCRLLHIHPREHLAFPTKESMLKREYATFIHITNTYRATIIDKDVQKEFFLDLLQLDNGDYINGKDLTAVSIIP